MHLLELLVSHGVGEPIMKVDTRDADTHNQPLTLPDTVLVAGSERGSSKRQGENEGVTSAAGVQAVPDRDISSSQGANTTPSIGCTSNNWDMVQTNHMPERCSTPQIRVVTHMRDSP